VENKKKYPLNLKSCPCNTQKKLLKQQGKGKKERRLDSTWHKHPIFQQCCFSQSLFTFGNNLDNYSLLTANTRKFSALFLILVNLKKKCIMKSEREHLWRTTNFKYMYISAKSRFTVLGGNRISTENVRQWSAVDVVTSLD
jgi:hypothetical protein